MEKGVWGGSHGRYGIEESYGRNQRGLAGSQGFKGGMHRNPNRCSKKIVIDFEPTGSKYRFVSPMGTSSNIYRPSDRLPWSAFENDRASGDGGSAELPVALVFILCQPHLPRIRSHPGCFATFDKNFTGLQIKDHCRP